MNASNPYLELNYQQTGHKHLFYSLLHLEQGGHYKPRQVPSQSLQVAPTSFIHCSKQHKTRKLKTATKSTTNNKVHHSKHDRDWPNKSQTQVVRAGSTSGARQHSRTAPQSTSAPLSLRWAPRSHYAQAWSGRRPLSRRSPCHSHTTASSSHPLFFSVYSMPSVKRHRACKLPLARAPGLSIA